jgi:hypothetical protein
LADHETLNRMATLIDKGSALVERRYVFQVTQKASEAARNAFPPAELPKPSEDDLQLMANVEDLPNLLGEGGDELPGADGYEKEGEEGDE